MPQGSMGRGANYKSYSATVGGQPGQIFTPTKFKVNSLMTPQSFNNTTSGAASVTLVDMTTLSQQPSAVPARATPLNKLSDHTGIFYF